MKKTFKSVTVIKGNDVEKLANAVVDAVSEGRLPFFVGVTAKMQRSATAIASNRMNKEFAYLWQKRGYTFEQYKEHYGWSDVKTVDVTETEWDGTIKDFEGNKHKVVANDTLLELSDDYWLVTKVGKSSITLKKAEVSEWSGFVIRPFQWSEKTVTIRRHRDGGFYGKVWGEYVSFKYDGSLKDKLNK